MRRCYALVVVGLLILPTTVVAQPDPASLVKQARELRKRGQVAPAAKL